MEYVILKIIEKKGSFVESGFFKSGSIVSVSPLMAQQLIDDGIAERYVRKQHGNNSNISTDR